MVSVCIHAYTIQTPTEGLRYQNCRCKLQTWFPCGDCCIDVILDNMSFVIGVTYTVNGQWRANTVTTVVTYKWSTLPGTVTLSQMQTKLSGRLEDKRSFANHTRFPRHRHWRVKFRFYRPFWHCCHHWFERIQLL